jgi:NAD(P)-dependent dehydrogenase (short-subunit alcohol dehydrogenase family)
MADIIKTPPITNVIDGFSVEGLSVVVTGGGKGIGKGISEAFAQGGASVAILARDLKTAETTAAELGAKYPGRFEAFKVDVSDPDSVRDGADAVFASFENIDVLVNNAGGGSIVDVLEEGAFEKWRQVIDVNLFGVLHTVHYFVPKMKTAGRGGSIINISSIGSKCVSDATESGASSYNVSKAGIDIFTQFLAVTLGKYGIRSNAILPGPTHSDADAHLPAAVRERIESAMPLHRFGEPIEIGALAVFLSSPAGAQMTGLTIAHDGGILLVGM